MVAFTSLGALIADAASRICSSLTLVRKNNKCGLSESVVPNVKLTCFWHQNRARGHRCKRVELFLHDDLARLA